MNKRDSTDSSSSTYIKSRKRVNKVAMNSYIIVHRKVAVSLRVHTYNQLTNKKSYTGFNYYNTDFGLK